MVKTYAHLIEDHHEKDIVFICGRYEGLDERFIEHYVDEQICLGDFVLSGGELAVMTILDSSLRHVKGILGNQQSYEDDSFEGHLLEHSQYTKPQVFEGVKVPEVLLSGHHQKIKEHQLAEAEQMTEKFRPDIWLKYQSQKSEKK